MANGFEVSLPIVRNAGTIGYVSVQWRATVNGRPAIADLRPQSGEITFAPGETTKTLRVEVLADDVPEIEEVRTSIQYRWIFKMYLHLALMEFGCFRSSRWSSLVPQVVGVSELRGG